MRQFYGTSSTEADVVAGALRCLRGSIPSLVLPVERLMEHPEPQVRERALRVALAWGSRRAWEQCEAQALDTQRLSVSAMTAYALLGGPVHRERLSKSATTKNRTVPVLRALGFSGSPDVAPVLLERLGAKDGVEAKAAAQALVAITGLDFRMDEFAAPLSPERAGSLPPFEQDDARGGPHRKGKSGALVGSSSGNSAHPRRCSTHLSTARSASGAAGGWRCTS